MTEETTTECEGAKDGCCASTTTNEECDKMKSLIAGAVAGMVSPVDPLALIAQLAITVSQMQKDMANMEKAIGQNMSEIINYMNSIAQRIQPSPLAGAAAGAKQNNVTPIKPPTDGGRDSPLSAA
jgi:hypothetical protein